MSKYFKLSLISGLCFLIFAFSLPVLQQASAAGSLPSQLVPCGSSASGQSSCTICHLWNLASNIINYIFYGLAIPILTIMLIWGGILMLFSFGNPSQITKGKNAMTSAIIGILITACSYLLISTIINTFAAGRFTAGWVTINCAAAITPPPPPPPPPPGPALSCNSSGQCVSGGGGQTCTTNTDCASTALQCSASSISPQIQSVMSCIQTNQAIRALGTLISSINTGSHTCDLSSNPLKISCHYGGTSCNGVGHALDASLPTSKRNPQNWASLQSLMGQCPGAGVARCEMNVAPYIIACNDSRVDHVHVNSSQSCGCN